MGDRGLGRNPGGFWKEVKMVARLYNKTIINYPLFKKKL